MADPKGSTHNTKNGAFRIEIWEPTYQMQPEDSERFVPRKAEDIIKKVLAVKLKDVEYDNAKCKDLSMEIAAEVKEQVKGLNNPRYKILVQAVIGEVKGQGCITTSRCLWGTDTDNYASYSMKNGSMFCTVMVFGLYLE